MGVKNEKNWKVLEDAKKQGKRVDVFIGSKRVNNLPTHTKEGINRLTNILLTSIRVDLKIEE